MLSDLQVAMSVVDLPLLASSADCRVRGGLRVQEGQVVSGVSSFCVPVWRQHKGV